MQGRSELGLPDEGPGPELFVPGAPGLAADAGGLFRGLLELLFVDEPVEKLAAHILFRRIRGTDDGAGAFRRWSGSETGQDRSGQEEGAGEGGETAEAEGQYPPFS